jgi:hypothetical protein
MWVETWFVIVARVSTRYISHGLLIDAIDFHIVKNIFRTACRRQSANLAKLGERSQN